MPKDHFRLGFETEEDTAASEKGEAIAESPEIVRQVSRTRKKAKEAAAVDGLPDNTEVIMSEPILVRPGTTFCILQKFRGQVVPVCRITSAGGGWSVAILGQEAAQALRLETYQSYPMSLERFKPIMDEYALEFQEIVHGALLVKRHSRFAQIAPLKDRLYIQF